MVLTRLFKVYWVYLSGLKAVVFILFYTLNFGFELLHGGIVSEYSSNVICQQLLSNLVMSFNVSLPSTLVRFIVESDSFFHSIFT